LKYLFDAKNYDELNVNDSYAIFDSLCKQSRYEDKSDVFLHPDFRKETKTVKLAIFKEYYDFCKQQILKIIENFEKIALENQYENITILCDETNWWVVASTVTSREDLSLSSSSLSSSSSSSFNSNALPDWLSGFPVDSTSYIQVVIGTAWQYMSFDPGDTINLYKVSGQTIWTEDGTEIPNLTNRLKLRTYKNGGSWYLQVMGRPEDTSYIEFRANVQISFSAGFVGGDVYTFLDIFDKPVCKLRIYDWPGQEHDYLTVSIPPFIDYKGQIFQSMTFIDH
jgi:hypothetical protein